MRGTLHKGVSSQAKKERHCGEGGSNNLVEDQSFFFFFAMRLIEITTAVFVCSGNNYLDRGRTLWS